MAQRHLPQESVAESTSSEPLKPVQSLTATAETAADTSAESATSTDATALTQLLQQETRARRKEFYLTSAWSAAFVTAMLWMANGVADAASLQRNLLLCLTLMIGMGWGMCLQISRRSYRRKRPLTNALAQIRDREQIGPLIRTLQVQNTPVRNLTKEALIDLLPTLQASDASLLGATERKILLRLLTISPNDYGYRDLKELFSRSAYRREIELRLAILEALEQVGGAYEIATVERLAQGRPNPQSVSKVPDEIRAAANECLPYLQGRASEQRASAQLLRASSIDATPGDALLRPVTTRSDTPPEQLLRATESQSAS